MFTPLETPVDRIFFGCGGLVALFVLLKTDLSIRILSYGRRRAADMPIGVKLLRISAAVVAIGVAVMLGADLLRDL